MVVSLETKIRNDFHSGNNNKTSSLILSPNSFSEGNKRWKKFPDIYFVARKFSKISYFAIEMVISLRFSK